MALFSDIDWLILLVAAAFLLLGKESGPTLRMLGRWYGRAGKLKQELLSEFTKAAEIPSTPGGSLSIRGALLGLDPPATHVSGIPAAVAIPPSARAVFAAPPTDPWNGSLPTPTWSWTAPVEPSGEVWTR
jgi:hypothetical protein